MSSAVYICENCGYRGTSPLVCGTCNEKLVYINRENTYCPNCDRYIHGFRDPCDGCGMHLEAGEVHFEPLD